MLSNIYQTGLQITNCSWTNLSWRTCNRMRIKLERQKKRSISMMVALFHPLIQVAYLLLPISSFAISLRAKIWMLVLLRSWTVWMQLKSWQLRQWTYLCSLLYQPTKMPSKWCSKLSSLLVQSKPKTSYPWSGSSVPTRPCNSVWPSLWLPSSRRDVDQYMFQYFMIILLFLSRNLIEILSYSIIIILLEPYSHYWLIK